MNKGWFKIHRELFDKQWFWDMGDRRILVFVLLARAAWEPVKLLDGTCLNPGELVMGRKELAKKTGLTEMQIRTSLDQLVKIEFINQRINRTSTRHGTVITIVNWHTYQGDSEDDNQIVTTALTRQQPDDNQTITTKKNLRIKELKKEHLSEFERIWAMYPNRKGRKAAERHFMASVKTPDDLMAVEKALKNYLADLASNPRPIQFIQHGSTWFNNWRDWLELATPASIPQKPKYAAITVPESFRGAE